ncbi:MAG: 50S ribosomal protein L24 [bacterium]
MKKTEHTSRALRLRTGDTVQVLAGADRGKKGKIQQILVQERRVVVEGVNLRSKSVRSRRQGQKGEIIQYYASLALSNVLLVCPHCSKTTRVSVTRQGGKRQRLCKKCKQLIEKT